jgi:lysyl-tRNA synthetase class 2
MSGPDDAPPGDAWRPALDRAGLARRAAALAAIRAFFAARSVLEVDTPQLVRHAVTDPALHSAEVRWPGGRAATAGPPAGYLHTSPEYAMKRLLAAGSGDIYQLCHVFRGDEQGPLHEPEFMLLEWYRVGWPMRRLGEEVDALLRVLHPGPLPPVRWLAYDEAFRGQLGVSALADPMPRLVECARAAGFEAALLERCGRDELLDLLVGTTIGPRLGRDGPVFLHGYPASQAALARLDPADPRTALRFELYLDGVELCNGFEELADAREQRARFAADRATRAARGLVVPDADAFLLQALESGLPASSGVAVGIDRLLMLAAGGQRLDAVLPFRSERA